MHMTHYCSLLFLRGMGSLSRDHHHALSYQYHHIYTLSGPDVGPVDLANALVVLSIIVSISSFVKEYFEENPKSPMKRAKHIIVMPAMTDLLDVGFFVVLLI